MSISTKPLISIVIPTRERADTLKFTLETALDQDNDHFEIVVSDNCSQDNTKEVVEAFSDSRIKYVNTGCRVSMCDNWDFALEHVSGDYVIYIGDDDGLMPGAINKLQKLIETMPCPIYHWTSHFYTWPIDGMGPIINFIAPISHPYEIDLGKLANFSISWGTWRCEKLPALYHSAVSKQVLNVIRERTGRVFHSMAPDIFMMFALPVFSSKAIHVGESLTVNGRSGKSNSGIATSKEGEAVRQMFIQEYGNYKIHPTLTPMVPSAVNIIPDSTLVAMDLFRSHYSKVKFNYNAMWAVMQRALKFDSTSGIIKKRREVRVFHSFSVMRFLFYSLTHALLKLRAVLMRKLWKKKVDESVKDLPQNIRDFVQLAEQLQIKIKS